MITSSRFSRALLPVFFMTLSGLTACGSSSSSSSSSSPVPIQSNAAILSGAQEVPPVTTAGTGSATMVVSADRTRIDLTLNIDGVFNDGITQAHLHPGAIGENGLPILWICTNQSNAPTTIPTPPACPPSPATITRSFTANDFVVVTGGPATFADAVTALLNGNTYINVHTLANPSGEIRGQVGSAGFAAVLSGANEVPAVTTATTGTASVSLDRLQSSLDFSVSTGTFATAVTQAHIHVGAADVNGPVIFYLCSDLAGAPVGVPSCAVYLTGPLKGALTATNFIAAGGLLTFADAVNALITGNTYVNVHTVANPDGEIRGQLAPVVP